MQVGQNQTWLISPAENVVRVQTTQASSVSSLASTVTGPIPLNCLAPNLLVQQRPLQVPDPRTPPTTPAPQQQVTANRTVVMRAAASGSSVGMSELEHNMTRMQITHNSAAASPIPVVFNSHFASPVAALDKKSSAPEGGLCSPLGPPVMRQQPSAPPMMRPVPHMGSQMQMIPTYPVWPPPLPQYLQVRPLLHSQVPVSLRPPLSNFYAARPPLPSQ